MQDPTKRFGDRAENYAKYRPGYPDRMLAYLGTRLSPGAIVADIGAGTGILTLPLLEHGYVVYAVEPNEPMRQLADRALSSYSGFHSVNGRAEATGLEDRSIDLITCAQAFHWFVPERTRVEFRRVLKPGGLTALIWNEREEQASDVGREYDELLKRMLPDYKRANHRRIQAEEIDKFFTPGDVRLVTFRNYQLLDREGFRGRLLSSSYVPNVGQPAHNDIVESADQIFMKHAVDGRVRIEYETKLYLGRWEAG
jgi:ubiquinone/menaquinone biosynthesis C-methylase UbiE